MPNLTVTSPWSLDAERVLAELGTSERGLSPSEADRRRAEQGKNEIQREAHATAFVILLRQFSSPLVLILIGIVVCNAGIFVSLAYLFMVDPQVKRMQHEPRIGFPGGR